jgi:hypothetical protein
MHALYKINCALAVGNDYKFTGNRMLFKRFTDQSHIGWAILDQENDAIRSGFTRWLSLTGLER